MEKVYEFELFRVLLEEPPQKEMFEQFPIREEILNTVLITKPSIALRQTVKWHIGNVVTSTEWIHFLIGKSSLKKQEHLDPESGDFVIMNGEESPFTYGMLHPATGLVAIAKKSKLAAQTTTVARRFKSILESTNVIVESNYNVRIKFLPDPQKFRTAIKEAYAVKSVNFTISPSNPLDIDSRIHLPSKKFVDETLADEGKFSVKGKSLNKKVVIETTNSVALVGDDASALIQKRKNEKSTRIHLNGDPSKVTIKESQVGTVEAEAIVTEAYKHIKK